MPELPEMKAEARRMWAEWGGATLTGYRALSISAQKTFLPAPEDAYNHPIAAIANRGKFLWMDIGPVRFTMHLMQGGRIKTDTSNSKRPRGGVARWSFEDGPSMLMTEPGTERRAGVWCTPVGQWPDPVQTLGPDADAVDLEEFSSRLRETNGRLHNRLRDQHVIAGIGRRLANEICWRAHVSPFASTATLDDEAIEGVWTEMREAIDESLVFEADQATMVASAKRPSNVHHRAGEPCLRCGEELRSVEYRTHTVVYCPPCQTAGRLLADNTTSKFLK